MIVYKATNKINGKSYIGQTQKSLDNRINKHFYSVRHKSNLYFHNALRKYDFDWMVLEECESKSELDKKECQYIKQYNTNKNGYNLTTGGEGSFGFKHSEKTKKKMSEKAKLRKPNFLGKKHTDKTKKKISESKKGKKIHSEEWKKKRSEKMSGENNPFYGKKHTKEALQKMSKLHKNQKWTDEQRETLSKSIKEWWKGRKNK